MRHLKFMFATAALSLAATAHAEETDITVRAIAADAKFIGTSMGGVRMLLRDAHSGEILAEGTTSGGTGNTQAIMAAEGRSPTRVVGGAAGFSATIDIDRPTLVELEASGPLSYPNSNSRVTAQRWVMPGSDIVSGDGWVVEMPGLVTSISTVTNGLEMAIDAKVELLCGCLITPAGLWDSEDYAVSASLWQEGAKLAETDLSFVQAPGGFAGTLTAPRQGRYKLIVHARNKVTGNSGVSALVVSSSGKK